MTTLGDLAQQLRNEMDRSATALQRIAAQLDAMDTARPVLVEVTYRSQHDGDAQISRADCGPACIAMLLGWRGTRVTIDDISRVTSLGTTNAGQLIAAAYKHGLALRRVAPLSLSEVEINLRNGRPMIALLQYGDLGDDRQNVEYNGLHWVVVVGCDADHIYIHDPNYWGARRLEGQKHPVARAVFDHAWVDTMPDALARQALVIV